MRKVIPVDLGGSNHRCVVAPPPRISWSAASVRALIEQTSERFPNADFELGFFHGGFPADELLSESDGMPLRLSCHPADLKPDTAKKFRQSGGYIVELEAMSLDPHVLRTCEREYTVARVKQMANALRDLGFQVGIHLVPGLPGQDVQGMLEDAEALSENGVNWVDFVRLWPAIGFSGSKLASWAEEGRWRPLQLGAAVNIIGQMVDIIEAQSIVVSRIGMQPGQDIPVKAVAGPVHPNIRGEVESRRFASRLDVLLESVASGARVWVCVNPKDLHLAKGISNINTRVLTQRHGLSSMEFVTDEEVQRGTVSVARIE